ncbi:MAG TPA: DUF3084 domain-containing protein [Armatimonadota bacterium]|jgi:uncharacterized protein (DUF3084 family)
MSIFTLLALIILPLLGGAIAWAGDVIGYRLGKSRRSLFGLRPRSTARLIAVVVGVVLPLVTMILAAVGSQEVRTALFRLTELQASNQQLQGENQLLTASVDRSRQEKTAAETAAAEAQKQVQAARARLQRAQADLTAAQQSLGRTRAQLATAQAERRRLTAQLATLQASRSRLQQDLAAAQRDLGASKQQLTKTQSELQLAQTQQKQVAGQLADTNKRYEALKTQETTLRKQVEDLRVEAEHAKVQLDTAKRQWETVTKEWELATHKLDQANTKLTEVSQRLAQQYFVSSAGQVRYEPGTELVRVVVKAGQSQAQVASSLRELVVLAGKAAANRGAGGPDAPSVFLAAPSPPDTPFPPAEDVVIKEVASQIRSAPAEDYVVVVRALSRSFTSDPEPVVIGLYAQPNQLVFPRGTVITSRVIDGSAPRAEVFQRLWGIRDDLRGAAQQAGLMADPDTGQYGQVLAEDLLTTLDALLSQKKPLEVQAVAAEDVRVSSAQPFLVVLKVGGPSAERATGGD